MTGRQEAVADAGRRQFGMRVRELRTSAGISQERLAELAGIHRTYVSDLERGGRNVSLDNILAIAAALGVTASELLRGVAR